MRMTCSVVRGAAELVGAVCLLAGLAVAGAAWTVAEASLRRERPRTCWGDISDPLDWRL
jgi:hypothetical protein